ncbi:T-lymphocyte activation antigen CD80-like isoform X1 [Corythoichthys intestinalis]|uniref:T-lymphocyte activation antigen CD80-like isoform X1 n=1 Tax=Corythoichthys intestinalis TaxID=161448 RepID=UPI0025A532B2|nr:T-lymphocyte activation antigen CD80-like isoform X1 [Corythoichthys intestinalis]
MRGPLWSACLLLNIFFTFGNSLDEECFLGIVGQPLHLSCFYPDVIASDSVSVQWRRNRDEAVRGDEDNEALATGNFTLRIPIVDPREDNASYSVVVTLWGNQSVEACTLCVRVAAPFSPPELQWEASSAKDTPSVFQCHSSGGFPAPSVIWLIDGVSLETSTDSAQTLLEQHPDSHLYDVTSYLTVNVTDTNVSCVIRNDAIDQTLTSTTHAVWHGPVVTRASDALWVFSTALCVVVGVMVAVGLAYQIHLDRVSKKKKMQHMNRRNRGYRRRQSTEETEVITLQSFNA